MDNKAESPAEKKTSGNGARENLTQLALTLYECPDGSIVGHPSQCREAKNNDHLEISNIFKS